MSFKEVKIKEEQSVSFSGGCPFHIDQLEEKKEAILNLGAGTYFVKKLETADDARINLVPRPISYAT